jgi:hypothetical protein
MNHENGPRPDLIMRRRSIAVSSVVLTLAFSPCAAWSAEPAIKKEGRAGFIQPDVRNIPDLFVWTDSCNVYVLRDGEVALLIDLGDGACSIIWLILG